MKEVNRICKVLLLMGGVTIATTAIASSVTISNIFSSGSAAVAAEVNDNFSAIKFAVDDNDSKINALEVETGFVSVSAQAFRNEDDVGDCGWNTIANARYGYYELGGDSDCNLVAAIQLPHNTMITSLTCYLYDNGAATQIFGRLYRNNFIDSLDIVLSTPPTEDSMFVQALTDITPNISGGDVIDNQNYAYHIAIHFVQTDTAGTNFRVYGCAVGYQ